MFVVMRVFVAESATFYFILNYLLACLPPITVHRGRLITEYFNFLIKIISQPFDS